jgi:hypothetical protein
VRETLNNRRSGWKETLRKHGASYLAWLNENGVLARRFETLAGVLVELLVQSIRTAEQARAVWDATPAVLARCNEQDTYAMPGAATAYAWIHFLDRYARAWLCLEKLVERSCLPMAKHGVRALDIGTGPGPSAFAVHDFYLSLTAYADAVGRKELRQPTNIACVELDPSTNHLRHRLAEYLYEATGRESPAVLALCNAREDFKSISPDGERARRRDSLRWQEDEYYDEESETWVGDSCYTADEANDIAQALHRYRLIVISNFLTTVGSVKLFESTIREVLTDACPGTVVVVVGGKDGEYQDIYQYLNSLTEPAGFRLQVSQEKVSSSETAVANKVYEVGQQVFQHLQSLAPLAADCASDIAKVRAHFTTSRKSPPSSQFWAYKKCRSSGIT